MHVDIYTITPNVVKLPNLVFRVVLGVREKLQYLWYPELLCLCQVCDVFFLKNRTRHRVIPSANYALDLWANTGIFPWVFFPVYNPDRRANVLECWLQCQDQTLGTHDSTVQG